MTAANGIHTFVNPVLYLGYSQYASSKDALAAYDEVRLWRGVLTDAQLAANATAGKCDGVVCGVITGSFLTSDAAFDPARNSLELALRLDDRLRLDLADVAAGGLRPARPALLQARGFLV